MQLLFLAIAYYRNFSGVPHKVSPLLVLPLWCGTDKIILVLLINLRQDFPIQGQNLVSTFQPRVTICLQDIEAIVVVSQLKTGRLRFLKSKPNMGQNPKTGYITMHLVEKVLLAHLVCDTRSIFFGICTQNVFLCRGILSHNFYDLFKNLCFLHLLLLLPGVLIIQQASLGNF